MSRILHESFSGVSKRLKDGKVHAFQCNVDMITYPDEASYLE